MGYEIPQQLQHQEKILFGLTLKQSLWVFIFGILTLTTITKTATAIIKYSLATFLLALSILFIFFDLEKWITNYTQFLRFRKADFGSKKLERLLEIKKIEKNTIHSHRKVAVLEVFPINFSLKNREEKESIMAAFRKFLNGLDADIQILITTTNLSLEEYLKGGSLSEDLSSFIQKKITQESIRNRRFFIILPEKHNLKIQVEVAQEQLLSLGLKPKRLNNKELLFFCQEFFKHKNKEKEATGVHQLLAPSSIENKKDYLLVNEDYHKIIAATGYPRRVNPGFLDKIISSNDECDIAIHIEPFHQETTMIILNKELEKQQADLYSLKIKKAVNPSLEIKQQDTRNVLENLQKGQEKLFNISLYIQIRAKTKEELDLLTKKIESELNSLLIIPKNPAFRQIKAYKSLLPIAKNELRIKRNITSQALAAFFPLTTPFKDIDNKGTLLGLNKNNIPYIKDIFSLNNPNGIILATSGSGKSYFTMLLALRQKSQKTKVIIIDPQGEYTELTKHCEGQVINISKDSNTIINPLDLLNQDLIEKRLVLLDILTVMIGEITEVQRAVLDKAIAKTYERKTINENQERQPPILGNLYQELKRQEKQADAQERTTYTSLTNRLYPYVKGVFGFLNRQTKLKIDKQVICFNIGDMPKQVKPTIMLLILDYVYNAMKKDKQRKLLIIDEAWSLLSKAEEANYIFEIVKTCRKYNLGLLLITQDVEDLLNSKAGKAALTNTSYTLLLRQKPASINAIVKTFQLSKKEKEILLTATKGKGILILDNEHQEINIVASPKEHEIITKKPKPPKKKKEEKQEVKKKKDVNITLELDKPMHYDKGLTTEEKNFLLNNKYESRYFTPIGKPRQEKVWIKPNGRESDIHIFLVENIKEILTPHTKKIKVAITKEPDITFKINKKKYAIEVETGKSFTKHKKRIEEKFTERNDQYGERLIVILAYAEYKRRYKSLLPELEFYTRHDFPKILSKIIDNNGQD